MFKFLPIIISALLGVALGLGTYTFQFAKGLSYFSNDPVQCVNCHIMSDQFDSWQKSSHHGRAVCNDCHMPKALLSKLVTKAENGWNHSVKFTLQNYADPIRARPANAGRVQDNCLRCHQEFVSDIRSAASHYAAGEVKCIQCHASVGHGPRR